MNVFKLIRMNSMKPWFDLWYRGFEYGYKCACERPYAHTLASVNGCFCVFTGVLTRAMTLMLRQTRCRAVIFFLTIKYHSE